MPAIRRTRARTTTVTISNTQLLRGLRLFAARNNFQRFTIKQFDAWPNRPFCAATVLSRFGTWRSALARIGIHDCPPRKLDSAALIKEFESLWRQFGRPPGVNLLRRNTRYSIESYRRRWGTLANLTRLITQHRNGKLSRHKLLTAPPPPNARGDISIRTRLQIFQRDHFRCTLCGHSPAKHQGGATNDTELHLDHIRPLSKGGTNHPQNLRTLCRACNLGRGIGIPADGPSQRLKPAA